MRAAVLAPDQVTTDAVYLEYCKLVVYVSAETPGGVSMIRPGHAP